MSPDKLSNRKTRHSRLCGNDTANELSVIKPGQESGFSLVEVMVGMLIGLLGVIIIMQVLSVGETQRRSTSSGADAQTNGALGMFVLERDIRQAGYGFTSATVNGEAATPLLNCAVNAYNNARSTASFSFTAAPLIVTPINIPAGDPNSDVIQIAYGNSNGVVEGATLSQSSASSVFPTYSLSNSAGFSPNEFVVFADSGLACWLGQVTTVTPNFTTTAGQWATAGGLGAVNYQAGARLLNLGLNPQVHVYAVRNGTLTMCDMLASACENAALVNDSNTWLPITPGIVSLKVSYGRDTPATLLATPAMRAVVPDTYTWNESTAMTRPAADNAPNIANTCFWERIPAVAIALLGKSTQKASSVVTASAPAWRVGGGGTFTMTGTVLDPLTTGTNWQFYRYKVFETLFPIRNVAWMDKTGC